MRKIKRKIEEEEEIPYTDEDLNAAAKQLNAPEEPKKVEEPNEPIEPEAGSDEETVDAEELFMLEIFEAIERFDTTGEAKKWIGKAIKRPGALHRALGVPQGEPIPLSKIRAAAKKKGRLGRQARLALVLRGMRKSKKETEESMHMMDAEDMEALAQAMENIVMRIREHMKTIMTAQAQTETKETVVHAKIRF